MATHTVRQNRCFSVPRGRMRVKGAPRRAALLQIPRQRVLEAFAG